MPIEKQIVEADVRAAEDYAVRLFAKSKAIKQCTFEKRETINYKGTNHEFEIASVKEIKNGVEVMAKAFDADGNQVGFGKDGSVDIERFKIINPFVFTPDGTTTEKKTAVGDVYQAINHEYNPKKALMLALAYTVHVKKQKHDASNIVEGKVGNTTSTIYPTDQEGYMLDSDATWSTAHDAATADSIANQTDDLFSGIRGVSGNTKYGIRRAYAVFDTSGIGSDTIDSATLSLYAFAANDDDSDAQAYVNIYDFTPADSGSIVVGDYDQFGTTILSTNVTLATIVTMIAGPGAGYVDFVLNATGEGLINGSGDTELGVREGHDAEDIATSAISDSNRVYWYDSTFGASEDPKLVIEHTAAAATFTPRMTIF